MKILVISVFPPTAVPEADHAYHQCVHLAEAGHEVHVITQESGVKPNDVPMVVNAVIKSWAWSDILPLARMLRQIAPEAILLNYVGHAYNDKPMITFAATLARVLCPGTPFVVQVTHPSGASLQGARRQLIHTLITHLLGQRKKSAFGTLLRDSTRVVVLSNKHLAALEQSQPNVSKKTVLIPPPIIMPLAPVDSETRRIQREQLGVTTGETLLAYFGYVYRGKGIETLFKAFHLLCEQRKDVKMALIGGGAIVASDSTDPYVLELRDLMRALNIEDKVRFTGGFSWDSDQGSRYLRAADVAVLPFDQGVYLNNSSLATVVTHGLPTVTTRGEMLEEPLEHQQNVFLCAPQDSEAFAQALGVVLADADLKARLHEGALELAEVCFSWQVSTTRMVATLRKAVVPTLPVACYE